MNGNTKFIGWLLAIVALTLFYVIIGKYPFQSKIKSKEINEGNYLRIWFSVLGMAGSILLIYFAFSSPAVIARWTEGNYFGIHLVLLISILIFIFWESKILNY